MADWQDVAKRKQEERDRAIPKEWRLSSLPSADTLNVLDIPRTCGLLTSKEVDITEGHDATSLAQAIARKKYTCVEVTTAYCKRAAIAQQLTNCVTEILFKPALQRATWLDRYLSQNPDAALPPLFGLPISVKDTFRVTGFDSSIGLAALAFKPSNFTSPLVSVLIAQGAIIHCKTNVPQRLMSADCENNVFGRALNPINKLLSAGGSSGGEGVMQAMRASAVGIGTDIAGSIRIPAMCDGVYGLCPSAGRVPFSGQESGNLPGAGSLGIEARAGPIAQSMRDCRLVLESIAAAKPWELEPEVIPGLWQTMDLRPQQNKQLTIGVLSTDNLTTPLPPIRAVLKEVADALSSAGVKVVDIPTPHAFSELAGLGFSLFSLEGGNHMADLLDKFNEPPSNSLKNVPRRRKPRTLDQSRELLARHETLRKEMLRMWDGVDAIICPMAAHPVPPVDRWGPVTWTTAWVVLDCPAGSLPVREFKESDLEGEMQGEPISAVDKTIRTLWDKRSVDRKIYLGSPLSIQVAAPRLQEKRLYEVMQEIDQIVHGNGAGSRTKSKL